MIHRQRDTRAIWIKWQRRQMIFYNTKDDEKAENAANVASNEAPVRVNGARPDAAVWPAG